MSQEESRLRVQRQDGIVHVEFIDRNILDEANIQMIGQELFSILDTEQDPKLLLSFANVDHLSSSALGTLITLNTKIKLKNGQLRLANIDRQIYEVFVITRLNQLFQISDTTEEARASFE